MGGNIFLAERVLSINDFEAEAQGLLNCNETAPTVFDDASTDNVFDLEQSK